MMIRPSRFNDPHWENVVTLLHGDGANGSTTFKDSGRKRWVTNGNAKISTAQGPFGSSGLLDGTGDFLSQLNSSSFQIASGLFTIEAWVRSGNVTSVRTISSNRGSPSAGWFFYVGATGKLSFIHWNTASAVWGQVAGATTLAVNTDYRVAVDFDGTTLRCYLNGVVDASSTSFTGTRLNTTSGNAIGRDTQDATRDWVGNIAEYRFTKGIARYAGTYTPSTEPFPVGAADPYWSSVTALVRFKGENNSTDFWDEVGRDWTASGNAQISTSGFLYGGACGLFDGNGDYISTPSHFDFNLGANDFTIETLVKPTAWFADLTYFPSVISRRTNNITQFGFSFEFGGTGQSINFYASNTGGGITFGLTGVFNFVVGNWYHIAVTRTGTTWRIFVNGVLINSSVSSFTIFNSSAAIRIAAYDNPVFAKSYFNGRIEDLRVTLGVSRYKGDFALRTDAFPNQ